MRARTLTPDEALLDYLHDHGLSRISKRLVSSGALDVVATAAPGIKDILILGKVKQLERAGDADLLVLDAPAAGHAITFLQSARALLDTVRVGPINAQARDVLEMLTDHERCRVVLVTLPEETPVNELVDTAFSLEDRVGVGLGPGGRQRPLRRPAAASTPTRPRPRRRPGATLRTRRGRRRWRRRPPFRARPHGAPGGAGRPAGRPAPARPDPAARSCSPPRSARPSSTALADRLLAEVDALPEVV